MNDYLHYLKIRGYSPLTIQGTEHILKNFHAYSESVLQKHPKDLTYEELSEYFLLRKETLSPQTFYQVFSKIKGFFRFLHQEGLILSDPTQAFTFSKGKCLPRYIPDEKALGTLLDQIDTHTYYGIRDKAILELFYSTGIRSRELRLLKLKDLDLKEGTLRIEEGKGGRGRMLPLGKIATKAVERYLEVTRPHDLKIPEEESLFLSKKGSRLTKHALGAILETHKNKSLLTKSMTLHSLRHATALHMLRRGASIRSIQELLGHESLSTTQIYTRLSPQDLKAVHQKYHPRSQKKI